MSDDGAGGDVLGDPWAGATTRYMLSVVVYAERDGQILLLKRNGGALSGQWFLPGGAAEPGELPEDVARRELLEESGLHIDGELELVGAYPIFVYGGDCLQLSYRGRVREGEIVAERRARRADVGRGRRHAAPADGRGDRVDRAGRRTGHRARSPRAHRPRSLPAPHDIHAGRELASAVMTDPNVSAHDVTVETADGPMRLYEAKPAGEPRGAIVVVQEAFGVNPHIEDVTRRAAAAGYHAVAPDFFHRSGPGAVVEYGKFEKVMEYFQALGSDAAILTDLDAALAHLRAVGFADSSIGVVGFCFGGRVSFLAALRYALGAAVGFYGGGIVTGRFPQFPALVDETRQAADAVARIVRRPGRFDPRRRRRALRVALGKALVDTEIVRYRRRRSRLPLRPARTTTAPTTRPTRGAVRSTGSDRTCADPGP